MVYINKTTHKFQQNQDSESNLLTMENVVKSCHILLEKIDLIRKKASAKDIHSHPFVLIVDEASLLCTKCSVTGISLFRLLRRAVNRLGSNCNFVFLTLGTNSDVLDLNLDLSFDSFRESVIGRTFPPFLLSRNWDLFIDYDELQKSPIGYNEMLKGRMMIFWASLGRPLWSSISFERLMSFVRTKICNKSVESGEAFLAFWMVRVGLLVNPTHVVTQHLVQSLMGTLLYVSPDLRSLRVYYPSEPVLAVEIRAMLMEDFYFDKYYAALERFIKQRAIDTGRYSEIISADICLLTIAKSKGKKMKCSWEYDKNLPKICNVNSFIFETSKFHTETVNAKIIELLKSETRKDGNFISKLFGEKYIIIEGIEFVRSLYGFEEKEKIHIYSQIERFLPKLMKSALINMTHYTQISTKFPFEALETGVKDEFKLTALPVADPRYVKGGGLCNQVTAEVLETMIIRGSGIMLAPNTFGLDHVIPVCLKPVEVETAEKNNRTKPEYSFIGVKVKRGSNSNIRKIVAKGALSNHYVRCGLHGSDAEKCKTETCKFRIPDDHFKRLLENGLMLVHTMTDDENVLNESDDTSEKDAELLNDLKKFKIDSDNYKITCESSLPGVKELIEELQQLNNQMKKKQISTKEYDEIKMEIKNGFKELIKISCPVEFFDKFDQFEFDEFKLNHYDGCRFIPEIYLSIKISKELSIHCMVKRRSDGINEKIVAIYSKGLEAFSNILPETARTIARRIIFYDRSLFDEIYYDPKENKDKKPPIKYTELITGVVSRNNDSSIPIANNYIRSKYNLPLIPDHLPDYEKVIWENINDIL